MVEDNLPELSQETEGESKVKFTHNTGNGGQVSVTLEDGANLSEVIERFEGFLKACGFVFEGELDFVKEEKDNGR